LIIVEVRQRMRDDFGGPLASIGSVKQMRIRRATAYFLLQERRWRHLAVRFDVVAVLGSPDGAHELQWLRNAFQ
jgi:Holliday junction resolvase-like predicted endonuclease